LLEHIDKWKLRDQEAPSTEERDNDNEDEPTLAERTKGTEWEDEGEEQFEEEG
jgi:hypothetical protein